MCTIVLALNVVSEAPLIVAANRDELLDRPSAPPAWIEEWDGVYAPRDLQRRGTWIGVNARGVLVALTNRADVKSERGRMSRGWLVSNALRSADTAKNAVICASMGLPANTVNGFNLIAVDRNQALLVRNDGRAITTETLGDGIHVITNLGVLKHDGEVETAPLRIRAIRDALYGIDTRSSLAGALALHAEGLDASCVHEPERNYGTKSSAFIEADADWSRFSYRHREGPACVGAFEEPVIVPIQAK